MKRKIVMLALGLIMTAGAVIAGAGAGVDSS